MAHIANCPHCECAVQIASLAVATQQVRCPWCSDPFTIAEVEATALPAPPLAEPVVEGLWGSPAAPVPAMESVAAMESVTFEPAAFDTTGSMAEGTATEPTDLIGDQVQMPHGFDAPESLEQVSSDVEVDWQEGPSPTFTFDGPEEEPTAYESAAPASPSTFKPRRKPPPPSPVGTILGIVLGGVIGLTLGYIVLVVLGWMMGRDTDSLGIWKMIRGGGTTELSIPHRPLEINVTPQTPFDVLTSGR